MSSIKILYLIESDNASDLFSSILQQHKLNVEVDVRAHLITNELTTLVQNESYPAIVFDGNLNSPEHLSTVITLLTTAPDTPLIVLTETTSQEIVESILTMGAYEFIEKDANNHFQTTAPFALSRLIKSIQKKQSLKKSEATLQLLNHQSKVFDQVGDAIICCNPEHKIRIWNKAAKALLGYTFSEAIENNISFISLDGSLDFLDKDTLDVLYIYGKHYIETQLRRKNNSLFDAGISLSLEKDTQGNVSGIILSIHNISAQKEAEHQNHEAQQRLQFHLNQTPLACIEWDLNGDILSWNPAAETIFGYTAHEAIGKPFTILIKPTDTAEIKSMFLQMNVNKGGAHMTNHNITKEGQVIVCEWHNTPLVDESGKTIGYASLARNITERIKAERALKASKEKADEASRSKDEFLAVMSHEIRTPMNSIIGFSDLLLESDVDKSNKDYLDIIKSNAYNLLEIINNVLNYSRLDSGKVKLKNRDTDIAVIMHEIRDALAVEAKAKQLTIECTQAADIPTAIHSDYVELRQILLNLVGNAVKFTEKGNIKIELNAFLSKQSEENPIWTYICSIQDTGIGIPEEQLETIFDTFRQVDSSSTREYGGSGLGLAICKKLAQLLNGEIWVESTLGQGSTFYFSFQATPSKQNLEEKTITLPLPKEAQFALQYPAKILLTEDRPEYQQLMQEMLSRIGYDCRFASDGSEAIEQLKKEQFDIIFMDVDMPKLNGVETTRLIRDGIAGSDNKEVYICAFTGHSSNEREKERCLNAGMDNFIEKPSIFRKLKSILIEGSQHKANTLETKKTAI